MACPGSDFARHSQLHAQGKTDQAKSDLARLAKIRAEREAAQAKRKAEAEGTLINTSVASMLILRTTSPAKAVEIEAKRKAEQQARAKRS